MAARLKDDIGLDHRNGLEYPSGVGGGKYREENDYRLIRSAATAGGAGQVVFSTPDYSAHPSSSRLREDFRSTSSSNLAGGGGGKNDFSSVLRPPPIPFTSSAGVGSGGAGYAQQFWNYGGGGGKR